MAKRAMISPSERAAEIHRWHVELDLAENPVSPPASAERIERRTLRRPEIHPALTKRSIWIGLILVTLVALLAPYNATIPHSSPFIGNHFPVGIITVVAVLILLVNPALMLFRKRPLATGELVV